MFILWSLFCFSVSCFIIEASAQTQKGTAKPCSSCHTDLSGVLPKTHLSVKGWEKGIAACLGCHKPDASGKATANNVSAGLHIAHVTTNEDIDCLTCHVWTPGKRFSLPGQKVSFGSPTKKELQEITGIFGSWKNSSYTDSLHGKANIMCGGCHGNAMAKEGDTVENSRCLACHGPMEALAARSAPKDFPDRNPHKSHLGEINCTVCHKGHSESKAYCLECHKAFKMKAIPGSSVKQ